MTLTENQLDLLADKIASRIGPNMVQSKPQDDMALTLKQACMELNIRYTQYRKKQMSDPSFIRYRLNTTSKEVQMKLKHWKQLFGFK